MFIIRILTGCVFVIVGLVIIAREIETQMQAVSKTRIGPEDYPHFFVMFFCSSAALACISFLIWFLRHLAVK